jgi:mandelate racemase
LTRLPIRECWGTASYSPIRRRALKPTADLIQNLAPLVEGEELAPAAIEQKLTGSFRLLGTQGLLGMALAGIDMALWDALARVHNVSLSALLGSMVRPLPAYGAVGYGGEIQVGKVAEDWARREFKGVKAKIGYPSVAGNPCNQQGRRPRDRGYGGL